MSEPAQIGPNAVLQLVPVLMDRAGAQACATLLDRAGIRDLPDGLSMIDEGPVVRLHQAVRTEMPDLAESMARDAGIGTARYILAHRIPGASQRLLRALPWRLSALLLAKAIAKNAWTFAGSGHFRVHSPLVFELRDNPMVRGETAEAPICHWHAAVFETLYRRLVHDDLRCVETHCAATGHDCCRFQLRRDGAVTAQRDAAHSVAQGRDSPA